MSTGGCPVAVPHRWLPCHGAKTFGYVFFPTHLRKRCVRGVTQVPTFTLVSGYPSVNSSVPVVRMCVGASLSRRCPVRTRGSRHHTFPRARPTYPLRCSDGTCGGQGQRRPPGASSELGNRMRASCLALAIAVRSYESFEVLDTTSSIRSAKRVGGTGRKERNPSVRYKTKRKHESCMRVLPRP